MHAFRTVFALAALSSLAASCGCFATAGATLRVQPPPLAEGDSAELQQRRIEDAVSDVGEMGRLTCAPPKHGGAELLGCWPADLGRSPEFVSMHLVREEDGYRVVALESVTLFSRPRFLCSVQERLVERIEHRLAGARTDRDPRLSCPGKAP
jgi:hypothetical protein